MKIDYSDFYLDRQIPKTDYRYYEILKFKKFIRSKKPDHLIYSDFNDYLNFRFKNVSSSTANKIQSVIFCFIIWLGKKTRNYKLLTDAMVDKLAPSKKRKKKDCTDPKIPDQLLTKVL